MTSFAVSVACNAIGVLLALAGGDSLAQGSVTPGAGDDGPVSGTAVSGGGVGTDEGSKDLRRCPRQYGTIAIFENERNIGVLLGANLPQSPTPLVRQIILQSNCFALVERGAAFEVSQKERELLAKQMGIDLAQVQQKAARLIIKTDITLAQRNSSGVAAGAASFLGSFIPFGGLIAAAAGSIRFGEAQVLYTVVDVLTSEVVATATGKAESTDFALFGAIAGGSGAGALGGFTNTPEGKVVAAAYVDGWNRLVPLIAARVNEIPGLMKPKPEPVPAAGPIPVPTPDPANRSSHPATEPKSEPSPSQ